MYSLTLRKALAGMIAGLTFVGPATASNSLSLVIPRLQLNVPLNYVSQNPSPVIYYQTRDTIMIAGHRVTHTRPFYYIDRLRRGDVIYIRYKNIKNVYRVSRVLPQVLPSKVRSFISWKGLVLSACTPRHFATYRYVILARLVAVRT